MPSAWMHGRGGLSGIVAGLALATLAAVTAHADDEYDCGAARQALASCRQVALDECVAPRQRVVLACIQAAGGSAARTRPAAPVQPESAAAPAAGAGLRARPTMGLFERPPESAGAPVVPASRAFDTDAANRAQIDRVAELLSRTRGVSRGAAVPCPADSGCRQLAGFWR